MGAEDGAEELLNGGGGGSCWEKEGGSGRGGFSPFNSAIKLAYSLSSFSSRARAAANASGSFRCIQSNRMEGGGK